MTDEQIKEAFFRTKEGILDEYDLHFVKAEIFLGRERRFYVCPISDDHYATQSMIEEGLSKYPSAVLNCSHCDKQWLVRPVDMASIIRSEEEKYFKLLERAPAIVRKVVAQRGWSEETIVFLAETHGIDEDTARDVVQGTNAGGQGTEEKEN